MRILKEVADRGSFSAAAEALSYTQSAVSQQIAALEREAGTQLVTRGSRGIRLTEAGEALVKHADAILTRLADAEAELEAIARPARRPPAPCGLPHRRRHAHAAGDRDLPRASPRHRADRPPARARGLAPDAQGRRARHRAHDRAVGAARGPEGLESQFLLDDPMYAALPLDHPLANKARVRLKDLAERGVDRHDRRLLVRRARAQPLHPHGLRAADHVRVRRLPGDPGPGRRRRRRRADPDAGADDRARRHRRSATSATRPRSARSRRQRCRARSAHRRRARCSTCWPKSRREYASRRRTWRQSPPKTDAAFGVSSIRDGARCRGCAACPKLARREREAAAALDDEAGALDRGARVARHVAAAGHARPDRRVHEALELAPALAVRDHVLVEAQLAARLDHAAQLGQRGAWSGTEQSTSDATPASTDSSSSGSASATPSTTRTGTGARAAASSAFARRYGSGSTAIDLGHRGRVVREVRADARRRPRPRGPRSPASSSRRLSAPPALVLLLGQPRVDAREQRVLDAMLRQLLLARGRTSSTSMRSSIFALRFVNGNQ